MTRPPPPRRHTGPALATCLVLATAALGFIVGHGNSAAAARSRHVDQATAIGILGAGPTTPVIATDRPRSVPGVSQSTRTVYRTVTGRTAVRTTYVAGPTRTVFATRTATATVTAEHTVTATATQTVTVTITAAPPAPTAGSTP